MTHPPLILHDFFLEPDGGGKVAHHIAGIMNGSLIGGHVDLDLYPEGHFTQVIPQGLQAYNLCFPPITKIGKLWRAFATMPIQDRPVTVFSGQMSPLAFKRVRGPKVYYCHTPPRLLYDKKENLLEDVRPIFRSPLAAMLPFYRNAYERAVSEMDMLICNSETVRQRLKKFLGLDSVVMHPPCGDGFVWLGQDDYYLSTARLDSLKRVETIVRAFLKMPDKILIVTGEGAEGVALKNLCTHAQNIHFAGRVDDREMKELVGRCIATIYIPEDEDFGMSPVESMAAGKPVIGVREGGVQETVVDGETGILLPPNPLASAVVSAVCQLTKNSAGDLRSKCEKRAILFARKQFDGIFLEALRLLTNSKFIS